MGRLDQKAPKAGSGLGSFIARGFVLSMASRHWVQFSLGMQKRKSLNC